MHALVVAHESAFPDPWFLDESNDKLMKLFSAVVFFKVRISDTTAKFKLNQNKSEEDQQAVVEKLEASGSSFEQAIACLMKRKQGAKVRLFCQAQCLVNLVL